MYNRLELVIPIYDKGVHAGFQIILFLQKTRALPVRKLLYFPDNMSAVTFHAIQAQIEENAINGLPKIQRFTLVLTRLLSSVPYSTPW
jgi:hypothetical protein